MPSIKDFEKKSKPKKVSPDVVLEADEGVDPGLKKGRRRPGRSEEDLAEMSHHELDAEYVETAKKEPKAASTEPEPSPTSAQPTPEGKFHLEFYGSEVLRAKAPEAFNLAEAVVDDWQKNGDFRALPLKNPWAQMAAAEGLKRVKKVEKKLEDVGVIPMAKMGFEFLKSKLKK